MKEDKKLILSDSVLKSESKKLAIQSNLGMVPLVLGTCATPILFVMEQVVFMYASLGVVSLGVLAIIINVFFRTSAFKRIYLEKHNKKMEKEAKDRREKLKEDLSTEAAIQQISAFERKYDLFKVSLNKELSSSSFSYQRLLGAFDQVFLLGLDKIEKIFDYERNQNTIDEQSILRDLKYLEKKELLEPHEKIKLEGLNERLMLREGYNGKISEILSQNESALTKMDLLQLNLTDLHKPKNMQIAMEELASLASALNFEEKNAIRLDK
jgi:hypothetical protein